MTVAEALRRFRREFNLNQGEVANKLGMIQQTYYRYESGRFLPQADVIITLAKEYDVSADYLLGLSDVPRPVGVEETEVKKAREFRAKALQFSEELRQFADGA